MLRAIALATSPQAPHGPNPRVGCVILSPTGEVVGEGFHRGAGTDHAEVAALRVAGPAAKGATAVVTLEPCRHTGQTGPCTDALIEAGITRVVFGQTDPNPVAAGGAAELTAAGVIVAGGLHEADAAAVNAEWAIAVSRGRPFVTVKLAASLDGRVMAADGSSRWISGPASREDVHALRSRVDAVIVGTGTVLNDNPDLTDRRPTPGPQPVRVVIGHRAIPEKAKVRDGAAELLVLNTHDLRAALAELFSVGARNVLVEAGPTLASAFLRADLADRLLWYLAPVLLGAGRSAVQDLGIETVNDALRWSIRDVAQVGTDLRIELTAGEVV